jgi:membrane protein implicated in regulation of membrane protease activity
LELLRTVQLSVKISQIFFAVTVGFAAFVILMSVMPLMTEIKVIGIAILTFVYFYKLTEYIRNRYCEKDVRLVLIYKTALFHLLSEEGK